MPPEFARLHADQYEAEAVNPFIAADVISSEKRQLVLTGKAAGSTAFTDEEKTVMLFAEYYWLDVSSIPQEAGDAVKAFLGESGHMILCEALGLIDGRIRTARCLRDFSSHQTASEHLA